MLSLTPGHWFVRGLRSIGHPVVTNNNLGFAPDGLPEWLEVEVYFSHGIEQSKSCHHQRGDTDSSGLFRASARLFADRTENQGRYSSPLDSSHILRDADDFS